MLRQILAKVWGVTTVEIVGSELLRLALRERDCVLLAPNHRRPCDRFRLRLYERRNRELQQLAIGLSVNTTDHASSAP
jgi:hypothetical protein